MYIGEKILGWIGVGMGTLAIINSLNPVEGYGFVGGIFFLASGATILTLLKKLDKLENL